MLLRCFDVMEGSREVWPIGYVHFLYRNAGVPTALEKVFELHLIELTMEKL